MEFTWTEVRKLNAFIKNNVITSYDYDESGTGISKKNVNPR